MLAEAKPRLYCNQLKKPAIRRYLSGIYRCQASLGRLVAPRWQTRSPSREARAGEQRREIPVGDCARPEPLDVRRADQETKPDLRTYPAQNGSTPTLCDQFFDCGEFGTIDVFSNV